VGRDRELQQFHVLLGRLERALPERSMVLTGLRGVGKTVLLGRMRRMAIEQAWLTIQMEARREVDLRQRLAGGVQDLIEDLDHVERARRAVARLRTWLPTFRGSISPSGDLSLALEPSERSRPALEDDVVELIDRLGTAARASDRGVAIFVDELQELGHESMEALCAAMHRANQETYPVVLVAAGLPTLPGLLADAKSYAERLFAYPEIGTLDESTAREAIIAPTRDVEVPGGRLSFSEAALERMVRFADGYPMMLQAIGKHTWAQARDSHVREADVAAAEQDAFEELSRELFRSRWQRATPRQRDYLAAIATHGQSARSADAARLSGFNSPQAAGPTRDELIAKGLIYAPRRGTVAFTVPQFDRFIKESTGHEPPDLGVRP
jgi:hypothetical protein